MGFNHFGRVCDPPGQDGSGGHQPMLSTITAGCTGGESLRWPLWPKLDTGRWYKRRREDRSARVQ